MKKVKKILLYFFGLLLIFAYKQIGVSAQTAYSLYGVDYAETPEYSEPNLWAKILPVILSPIIMAIIIVIAIFIGTFIFFRIKRKNAK
jgi:hypothetical protein